MTVKKRVKKTGRPRISLTTDELDQVERLAGLGLTQRQICLYLGISERTMNRRKQDEETVLAALERGKAKAEAQVGDALFNRCISGDVPAIRWYEMTRANRSERQTTELKGDLPELVFRIDGA